MNISSLVYTFLIVVCSALLYGLFGWVGPEKIIMKWAVVAIASCKTFFFLNRVITKELDLFDITLPNPRWHAVMVTLAVLVIILSFTIDTTFVYFINPDSFDGIPAGISFFSLFFKMFFYCSHFFFWMGVVHIYPKSTLVEYVTLLLSLTTFVTLAFSTIRFVTSHKET